MNNQVQPILSVDGLYSGYSGFEVLHDVSLTVYPGEIVSIIGPNGAGKSTALKTIYGLVRTEKGSIFLRGESIERLNSVQRLRRGLAFVLQGRSNFPFMTVQENLEMAGYTLPEVEVRANINRIFESFPMLAEKRRHQAGTLSGGQQQFLEMAMGMMLKPILIMLDEPSLGLDPINYEAVFLYIQDIYRAGVAILMVEQNAAKALSISDRAYVLEQGCNRLDGPANTILADPEIKRLYLGG